MSMLDETPDYFVREGKIWKHYRGYAYSACGYDDYTEPHDCEQCEATQRNIRRYADSKGIYSYDNNEYIKPIESKFKDAFGKELYVGDEVLTVDTNYSDRFEGFIKAKIVGFTEMFAKLEVTKYDEALSKYGRNISIKRIPSRLVLVL